MRSAVAGAGCLVAACGGGDAAAAGGGGGGGAAQRRGVQRPPAARPSAAADRRPGEAEDDPAAAGAAAARAQVPAARAGERRGAAVHAASLPHDEERPQPHDDVHRRKVLSQSVLASSTSHSHNCVCWSDYNRCSAHVLKRAFSARRSIIEKAPTTVFSAFFINIFMITL